MLCALDFETLLISPGAQAPDPVCLAWARGQSTGLADRFDARDIVECMLLDEHPIAIANAAFDMSVTCAAWPELVPLVFDAYERGVVRDVILRQKLIDIAHGEYRQHGFYSLAGLSKRLLGIELAKEDTWRLRYGELTDTPLKQWPQDALDYPIKDVETHRDVYLHQEYLLKKDGDADILDDEPAQCRAAFALTLMSAWGLRTDAVGVAALRKQCEDKQRSLRGILEQNGLLVDGKRKVRKAQALMKSKVEDPKLTKKGQEKKAAGGDWDLPKYVSVDEEACKDSGDPTLEAYAEYTTVSSLLNGHVKAMEIGVTTPIHTRFDALMATGRTSSGGGVNIQNIRRAPGARECFVPREGHAYISCDYDKAELHTLAQVCINLFGKSALADALNDGRDPHLELGAEMAPGGLKDPDIKDWRQMAKCFHPDTEVLTKSGWVGITKITTDDEIMAAYPLADGKCSLEWEKPLRLTHRYAEELVHLKCEGIDLRVTPDHRMVGYRNNGMPKAVLPEELSKSRYWPNAGLLRNDPKVRFTNKMLKLAVATQADGSYSGKQIRFGFTRKRKIDRMRAMLVDAGCPYKERISSQGATEFVLRSRLAGKIKSCLDNKMLPWRWLQLSPTQRALVLDEAEFWDGCRVGKMVAYSYSSTKKQNIDVLQAMAAITERKTRATMNRKSRNPRELDCYRLGVKRNSTSRGGALLPKRVPHNDTVYCVTLPSGALLVRDGGVPVITFQCSNFGLPGGLGANGLIGFSKSNYGVILSEKEARHLIEGHAKQWPQIQEYLRHIHHLCDEGGGLATVHHYGSGRRRGHIPYTVCANTFFQGMAADGAKRALFEVARECYELTSSALHGCRPVNFIHDEIIIECPIHRVHGAAQQLQAIMIREFNHYTPDVPVSATPHAMDRWSKKAEPVYDKDGRLQVWKYSA